MWPTFQAYLSHAASGKKMMSAVCLEGGEIMMSCLLAELMKLGLERWV